MSFFQNTNQRLASKENTHKVITMLIKSIGKKLKYSPLLLATPASTLFIPSSNVVSMRPRDAKEVKVVKPSIVVWISHVHETTYDMGVKGIALRGLLAFILLRKGDTVFVTDTKAYVLEPIRQGFIEIPLKIEISEQKKLTTVDVFNHLALSNAIAMKTPIVKIAEKKTSSASLLKKIAFMFGQIKLDARVIIEIGDQFARALVYDATSMAILDRFSPAIRFSGVEVGYIDPSGNQQSELITLSEQALCVIFNENNKPYTSARLLTLLRRINNSIPKLRNRIIDSLLTTAKLYRIL